MQVYFQWYIIEFKKQRNWIFKITKLSTRGQQEIRGLKWSAPLILWRILFSFVSFYCYQYLVCFALLLFFVLPCSCFLLSGSDRRTRRCRYGTPLWQFKCFGEKREVLCISSVWNCHSWCSQPGYRSLWWTGVFGAKQALKGGWWFLCKHPVVKRTGDVLSLTVMELKLQRWHSGFQPGSQPESGLLLWFFSKAKKINKKTCSKYSNYIQKVTTLIKLLLCLALLALFVS